MEKSQPVKLEKSLAERTCKVLVVEARIDIRAAIREAVKGLGFADTMVVSSVKEAWDIFATDPEPPLWVVSSLLGEDDQNALHLLMLFLRETKLHGCRLSLILQDEERYLLPNAFELGLLSWHAKPFTLSSLQREFEALLTSLKTDPSGDCYTACSYLRSHLSSAGEYEAQASLEEALIRLFPNNGDFFLNLAEAQQMAGDIEGAKRTLGQARYLGARVAKGAKQLSDVLNSDQTNIEATAEVSFAQAFDVKNALIIDSDEASGKVVKDALAEIGVSQCEIFSDGESAWQWVTKNGEPSLILQEWRIPKLTGPALLQRWRAQGFTKAPIIIISSLVKGKDQMLVRELGAALVFEKPIERESFIAGIMATIRQEKFPSSVKTLERKILGALAVDDLSEAQQLRESLIKLANVPLGVLKCIDASFAFQSGNLSEARKMAVEALKAAGDSLTVLNLLGKIFLKLRSFEDAMKCFNKAQELSSQNLERLCMIAEAQTELGNFDEAKATLDEAKKVDTDSINIKEAEIKLAITSGETATASQIMQSLESLGDIVAYTNNRAVSLAKSNDLKGSQELYEKALASLPTGESKYRPMILYNLALAYVRSNNLKEALANLAEASSFNEASIYAKAKSLQNRAEQALAGGKLLLLKSAEASADEIPMPEHSQDLELFALDIKPGELGAHQVFHCPSGMHERVAALVNSFPKNRQQFASSTRNLP